MSFKVSLRPNKLFQLGNLVMERDWMSTLSFRPANKERGILTLILYLDPQNMEFL